MTIYQRVKVQSGGRIEIRDPELPEGAEADVAISLGTSDEAGDSNVKSIWEEAQELSASLSPEDWAKLPRDLAKNFRHYRHGAPKEGDE